MFEEIIPGKYLWKWILKISLKKVIAKKKRFLRKPEEIIFETKSQAGYNYRCFETLLTVRNKRKRMK